MNAAADGNIALAFGRWATRSPNAAAVVCEGRSLSFVALDEEAARVSSGLRALGLAPGERVALMVPPSLEFFVLAVALFRAGAVPVFVDPGLGLSGVGRCLEEAAPAAFVGTPKAHLARFVGGWGRRTLRRLIVARGAWPGATPLAALRAGAGGLRAPELPGSAAQAAVLFTSGSTGAPKGVIYTHGVFFAQLALLESVFAASAGEPTVATFPLFALFDAALGQTVHVPRMDFARPGSVEPRLIAGLLESSGARQLFGSPALLDVVGRHALARGATFPGLRRVLSAGAPVAARILRDWQRLAPSADIHTPYGATEALPVATITAREVLSETASATAAGRGTCVGRPAPGVEVAIIRVCDEAVASWDDARPLPAGGVGEICARGSIVTESYHGRPRETALAKIAGPGGAVWHRMGDVGYLDERGRLWYCGRKSQRVETSAGTLWTDCCEGVFNARPGVRRSALVGARGPGASAPAPMLCVELEDGADARAVEADLLETAARNDVTRQIRRILFHPRFPVDVRHNAKIFRERLALWAESRS